MVPGAFFVAVLQIQSIKGGAGMTEWYSRSEEEVFRELSSCRRGLTDAEAHSRLENMGKMFYMSGRLYPGGRFSKSV